MAALNRVADLLGKVEHVDKPEEVPEVGYSLESVTYFMPRPLSPGVKLKRLRLLDAFGHLEVNEAVKQLNTLIDDPDGSIVNDATTLVHSARQMRAYVHQWRSVTDLPPYVGRNLGQMSLEEIVLLALDKKEWFNRLQVQLHGKLRYIEDRNLCWVVIDSNGNPKRWETLAHIHRIQQGEPILGDRSRYVTIETAWKCEERQLRHPATGKPVSGRNPHTGIHYGEVPGVIIQSLSWGIATGHPLVPIGDFLDQTVELVVQSKTPGWLQQLCRDFVNYEHFHPRSETRQFDRFYSETE